LADAEAAFNEGWGMATRINVSAVRACPASEVRAVMSQVLRSACAGPECTLIGDQLEVHEHGGWTWFITSVWGVNAGDLNRGLCQLARPALQFTTSDGDRWYLTVHGGPRGQVHFLHEFGYHSHAPDPAEDAERQAQLEERQGPPPVDPRLAFLEDDPPPSPARPKAPFDLVADGLNEMGAAIPDEFRASVAHLPYSAAMVRYQAWHAEQLTSALTGAGIPHNAAAVRSVLFWETVTDNEPGSDLGNLPRLLSVLGLGDFWDDWVRQAEAPPSPPEPEMPPTDQPPPEPPPVRPDHFGPVWAIVEPLGLAPVAGGPFALPLDDLPLVRFFVEALSIHDTAGVVLTVALPQDCARAPMPAPAESWNGAVEQTADGFRVGLDNHLWLRQSDLTNQLGKDLAHLLFHLPGGSTVDLAFARTEKPALTQRYRGAVAGGEWQIGETFPPLTREAFAGGMELARYAAQEPEKHELRNEAEAEAVVELARRDPNLWDLKVQRQGRTVWSKSDIVGHLPKVIFRHRFAAFWDVAAHDREAAGLYQQHVDLQRQIRRAGAEATRRRAAPHDDEVLLQGKCGRYWRSDFARLTELEQETRGKIDTALAGRGFSQLGDLVAKKERDILLRTYVAEDRVSYAILLAKRTMYLGYELFSRFADGSILITTTRGGVDSQPGLKVFAKTHPGLEPAALYEQHRGGIERFQSRKGTKPVPLSTTLRGIAREYDRVLARRAGISQRIRIIAAPAGEPPAEIRAAWVGCVMPLFATTDDPRVGKISRGIVSRRQEGPPQGFTVQITEALRALESHNPGAARWWREQAGDVIRPGQLLVFREEACELVEDADTAE
jgi:hypothetical protein